MEPDWTALNAVADAEVVSLVQEQGARAGAQLAFATIAMMACAIPCAGTLKRGVDVYNGPEGDGYVVRFIYEINGQRWCRCEGRGPQAFRTHAWNQLISR